jgi:uncharacterized protein DUF4382
MKMKTAFALATILAIAALGAGCSSSNTGTSGTKGALAVHMGATGTMPALQGGVSADQQAGPTAATVTISAASARQVDGTWVSIAGSFPMTVDLIALAANGNTINLPADLVPEGQYNALQFTITAVNLTLQDGTTVAITPPAAGWMVLIPVDFTVTAGKETSVTLRFHVDGSFKSLNGEFEFEPEMDVESVEHH